MKAPVLYRAHETARMQALDGIELASFGRRASAFALDFAAAVLSFTAVVVPATKLATQLGWVHHDVNFKFDFHSWYSVVWLVLYFGLLGYQGDGRTPGKRLVRIRAVSLVEERLTLWAALERALGYVASTGELGFGFLQYFTHPNHRTLHDRIAETIVVRERRKAD